MPVGRILDVYPGVIFEKVLFGALKTTTKLPEPTPVHCCSMAIAQPTRLYTSSAQRERRS